MLGCLYGQAIGDALGLGTEFLNKNEVLTHYPNGLSRYEDIIQDAHRRRWHKGAWTDDTDMMLCILPTLDAGQFNVREVAQNFKDWHDGAPMGIGRHMSKVLCFADYVDNPEWCSETMWKYARLHNAANGALMRTSVVGLVPENYTEQAEAICKLTHYDPRCVGSCVIATSIIHNLVWHNKLLSYNEIKTIGEQYDDRIAEWIDLAYQSEDIAKLDLDEPNSIGYTLRTLAAALWCYWHADSFESGLLAVVNEGGDADTNGAISCAILGAKYGYNSIPKYYIDNLHNEAMYRTRVEDFVHQLIMDHFCNNSKERKAFQQINCILHNEVEQSVINIISQNSSLDEVELRILVEQIIEKYFDHTIGREKMGKMLSATGCLCNPATFLEKFKKEYLMYYRKVSLPRVNSNATLQKISYISQELEKRIDEILKDRPKGLGFCHSYWATKKRLLFEVYGIVWYTPAECNPFIKYD